MYMYIHMHIYIYTYICISEYEYGVSINGVSQNDWFIIEHAIKMDDLEVPLF